MRDEENSILYILMAAFSDICTWANNVTREFKRTCSQEPFVVDGDAVHGAEVGKRRRGVPQRRRFAVGTHGVGEIKKNVRHVTKNSAGDTIREC